MRQYAGYNGVRTLTPIPAKLNSDRCLSRKILLMATGSDHGKMVYYYVRDYKGNLFEVFSFDDHGSQQATSITLIS